MKKLVVSLVVMIAMVAISTQSVNAQVSTKTLTCQVLKDSFPEIYKAASAASDKLKKGTEVVLGDSTNYESVAVWTVTGIKSRSGKIETQELEHSKLSGVDQYRFISSGSIKINKGFVKAVNGDSKTQKYW